MESEVFTPLLEQFLLTPLVAWVRHPNEPFYGNLSKAINQGIPNTCPVFDDRFGVYCHIFQVKAAGHSSGNDGTKLSEYIELLDGVYLNEIMLEM
jgi:hypothetical protein